MEQQAQINDRLQFEQSQLRDEIERLKTRNKATVRAALREKLYERSPQLRPRGPRKPKAVETT